MDKQHLFEQALRTKAAYRKDAQALSWEEKIASIERMRAASNEARKAMSTARQRSRALKPEQKSPSVISFQFLIKGSTRRQG